MMLSTLKERRLIRAYFSNFMKIQVAFTVVKGRGPISSLLIYFA